MIFGTQQIANFTQSSLPQLATYLLAAYVGVRWSDVVFAKGDAITFDSALPACVELRRARGIAPAANRRRAAGRDNHCSTGTYEGAIVITNAQRYR